MATESMSPNPNQLKQSVKPPKTSALRALVSVGIIGTVGVLGVAAGVLLGASPLGKLLHTPNLMQLQEQPSRSEMGCFESCSIGGLYKPCGAGLECISSGQIGVWKDQGYCYSSACGDPITPPEPGTCGALCEGSTSCNDGLSCEGDYWKLGTCWADSCKTVPAIASGATCGCSFEGTLLCEEQSGQPRIIDYNSEYCTTSPDIAKCTCADGDLICETATCKFQVNGGYYQKVNGGELINMPYIWVDEEDYEMYGPCHPDTFMGYTSNGLVQGEHIWNADHIYGALAIVTYPDHPFCAPEATPVTPDPTIMLDLPTPVALPTGMGIPFPGSGSDTGSGGIDACADHGGTSYVGDSCVCPGVIDHVIICGDGTKLDNVTNQSCTPTESCSSGGTTGGAPGDPVTCGCGLYGAPSTGLGCSNGVIEECNVSCGCKP
jgi:hypothetical protein